MIPGEFRLDFLAGNLGNKYVTAAARRSTGVRVVRRAEDLATLHLWV